MASKRSKKTAAKRLLRLTAEQRKKLAAADAANNQFLDETDDLTLDEWSALKEGQQILDAAVHKEARDQWENEHPGESWEKLSEREQDAIELQFKAYMSVGRGKQRSGESRRAVPRPELLARFDEVYPSRFAKLVDAVAYVARMVFKDQRKTKLGQPYSPSVKVIYEAIAWRRKLLGK
jgi:hypothetical protein